VEGIHVIKDNLFDTPPLFRMIQSASGAAWKEMYKVFNMGHRLEIYTDRETAKAVIDAAENLGIGAQLIGRCAAADKNRLTLLGEEEIVYE
jgi:phosphoribosylformylglycinamidine cyclo-ligase